MEIKPGHKFTFNNVPYTVTKIFGSPENKCWVAKTGKSQIWFTEEEILKLQNA